ncbi:MAG: rhodanese-like domain-containing protein [Desulfomonilaceae bacterium]
MKHRWVTILAMTAACALWLFPGAAIKAKASPTDSNEHCEECRDAEEEAGLLHGNLVDVSQELKTFRLQIGKDIETLYFDDSTALKNASAMQDIPIGDSLKVLHLKKRGKILAKEVEVKKGLGVPPQQLASVEEVAKLVSLGPDRGNYVLLDGRPVNWYSAGHIPTAQAMPIWVFDNLKDKLLPKDKDILQIYYCSGFG